MKRLPVATLLVISHLLLVGCGGSSKKEEPKAPVKGIVNLDGKPMPTGEISFSIAGQPPRVLEITNGGFSGDALEGKNKIEITLMKDDPKASTTPAPKVNVIPQKYNVASKLEANVTTAGPNDFKFDITSK